MNRKKDKPQPDSPSSEHVPSIEDRIRGASHRLTLVLAAMLADRDQMTDLARDDMDGAACDAIEQAIEELSHVMQLPGDVLNTPAPAQASGPA